MAWKAWSSCLKTYLDPASGPMSFLQWAGKSHLIKFWWKIVDEQTFEHNLNGHPLPRWHFGQAHVDLRAQTEEEWTDDMNKEFSQLSHKVCQGLTRFDKVWQGLTRFDKVWKGLTRFVLAVVSSSGLWQQKWNQAMTLLEGHVLDLNLLHFKGEDIIIVNRWGGEFLRFLSTPTMSPLTQCRLAISA